MLYLEDFLELSESLPTDFKEHLTELRVLDLEVESATTKCEEDVKVFFRKCRESSAKSGPSAAQPTPRQEEEFERIRAEYAKAMDKGEEKIKLVEMLHKMTDFYASKLNDELEHFKLELEADNAGITEVLEHRSLDLDCGNQSSVVQLPIFTTDPYGQIQSSLQNGFLNGGTPPSTTGNTPKKARLRLDSVASNSSSTSNFSRKEFFKSTGFSSSPSSTLKSTTLSSRVHPANPYAKPMSAIHSGRPASMAASVGGVLKKNRAGSSSNMKNSAVLLKKQASALAQLLESNQASPNSSYSGGDHVGSYSAATGRASMKTGHRHPLAARGSGHNYDSSDLAEEDDDDEDDTMDRDYNPSDDLDSFAAGTPGAQHRASSSHHNQHTNSMMSGFSEELAGVGDPASVGFIVHDSDTAQSYDGGVVEEGEERYCICNNFSHGDMVACDNASCPYQWFHFACVGITAVPVGEWFCPECSRQSSIGHQSSSPMVVGLSSSASASNFMTKAQTSSSSRKKKASVYRK